MSFYNMKIYLTSLLYLSFIYALSAQEFKSNHKKSLILNAGIAYFPDVFEQKNNNVLEIGYKHILSNDFAYEVFINRSYTNNTKSFFNSNTQVLEYLNRNESPLFFNWEKLETYAAGIKGHFYVVNTPKTEFSIYLGFGVYSSNAKVQTFDSLGFNLETGEITRVDTALKKDSINRPFTTPGFSFRYWLWEKIAIGINAFAFFEIHNKKVFTQPIQANFYSLVFNLNYKL